jgi:hypothetical protein
MDILSKYQNFSRLNIDEKLEIKRKGGPKPELIIECSQCVIKKTRKMRGMKILTMPMSRQVC